jgi:nickel transport protein
VIRSVTPSLAALVALAAVPAAAHETLHEVQRGKAIAVKGYFADGEVLAYAAYEVYSPADPRIPHQKGRTDRSGWVAFVPDVPGKWRVRVIDGTGHGLDVEVDAEAPRGAPAGESPSAGATSPVAFVLRPLLGLAVIGIVFAALVLVHRRKGAKP